MARTIDEIHSNIMNAIADDNELNTKLYSSSKVAVYRLFAYIIASAIWILEKLFDQHKSEITDLINAKNTHNLRWYADFAKKFQFGDNLLPEKDYYDPIDESKMIVSHSAVDENNGTLIMKVAKNNYNELAPLDASEIDAFANYINKIKDAGVKIIIVSDVGDNLKLHLDIWYNPLILDENGKLLQDISKEPVKDTIINYIKSLPFNGEFIPAHLTDALQQTTGVDIPVVKIIETKFGSYDWAAVNGKVVPNAGYLIIDDNDLQINYIANV